MTVDKILKAQQEALRSESAKALEEASNEIGYFISFMGNKYGIALNSSNFRYVPTIGVVLKYPKIIDYLITDRQDKEALYDFGTLSTKFIKSFARKGVFKSDKFYLLASSLFRRGHKANSNFEPGFLHKFWSYANAEVKSFIAMDEDRVRIDTKAGDYMEYDRWFGPPFNSDISKIPDDIVRLCPPGEISGSFELGFFADVYAVDIKWYKTVYDEKVNGMKISTLVKAFQAEEFKQEYVTLKFDGQIYHPVRYVHAEYDIDKKYFKHFDGALHLYTPDEYYARRGQDFHYNLKNANQIKTFSKKLFKFDGKMSVEDWIEFCGLYFNQNPLVYEYFAGKLPDEIIGYMKAFEVIRKNKKDE